RNQINSLGQQAWYSLLCVFLVLLLFIHEFRAPLLILSSIALSVLLSIILLYLSGYTLNLYTMAAITIALGMVVDNAIVVYEQVRPGLPDSRKERIRHVAGELRNVIVPVIGNTLTTVGIFIPLIFALQNQRFFLEPLGIAMSLTLLSSILICLTWIPYALIWLIPLRFHTFSFIQTAKKRISGISHNIRSYLPSGRRVALLFFYYLHKLRWPVYIALIFLIGIPLFLIPAPNESGSSTSSHWYDYYFQNRNKIDNIIGGLSYRFYSNTYFGQPFNISQNQTLSVDINTPLGTPLKEIDKIAHNFEAIAGPYRYAMDYFKTQESEQSGARITYHFKKQFVDSAEPYMLKNDAIYLAARTGNSSIGVNGFGQGYYSGGGGGSVSFRYKLTGYSYNQLLNLANEIKRRLVRNPRVSKVDLTSTSYFSRNNLYQYVLRFNKNRLLLKDLNQGLVTQNLELETNDKYSIGRVYLDNRQLYLMARMKRPERVQNHLMTEHRKVNGKVFSLNQVGHIKKERVMSTIRKDNQSYTRYVSFNFIGPYEYGQQFAKHILKQLPVPLGAKVSFGGSYSFGQNSKQMHNLILLIIAAIVVVWMIVSALLESWGEPLVIILSIPLSFIGIMSGFLYTYMDFGRGAFAGTMLLIGVVVNNAILLMHGHRLQEQKGIRGTRSWIYTYKNRMTSVLLTTMTTLAGLIPLMLQGSSEFWNTMSVTVFWGLSISTVLIVMLAGIWDKQLVISNE
ncbi:MAG TPA: efflux RND transporter permease subunit, partial [Balneolales bacterium]|nr:efflux RND transporter permease subunit [Balneolales bacterium]